MGVLGLTTFIDENQRLLSDLRLHDTPIIIDGNNLYHFLYYYFQVSHNFGGDYDRFAEKTAFFFETLATCNIQPYVVFDGAYDSSGQKLRTALKRASDRIQLAASLSRGGRGKILPILAQETFRNALNRLRVPHVTCNFEADHQIAALAIKWKCPVLTNDSDFFIYDIPAGIVLLDYLNLKLMKEKKSLPNYDYLNVQVYYVANIMKEINTRDCKLVALFATLLGNDLVDGKSFESFFARASLPKKSSKFRSVRSKAKIASLLGWLASIHDFSNAVSIVLSFLLAEKREQMREVITKSVDEYTNLNCEVEGHFTDVFVMMPVKSFAGNNLPDWFLDRIKKGEIPVRALNAVTLRRVILLAQIAVMSEPSTYRCSVALRRFLYAVLLSIDVAEGSEDTLKGIIVSEHDREGKHLRCKTTQPLWVLNGGRRTPRLSDLPALGVEERRSLLLDALDTSQINLAEFPLELQLLAAATGFWIRNANPQLNTLHLEAVLVCCVKLGFLRTRFSAALASEEDPPACLPDNVLSKLETFALKPHHNHAVTFDGNVIHAFSQFQSCLESAIYTNQLLLLPFPPVDPATVFSGTFLYNFYRELHGRKDPELYVEELLGRGSEESLGFAQWRMTFRSLTPEGSLVGLATGRTAKSKKQKRQKQASREDKQAEDDLSEEDQNLEFSLDCDISNKFSCLMASDS